MGEDEAHAVGDVVAGHTVTTFDPPQRIFTDWDNQYDAARQHTDFCLHTLALPGLEPLHVVVDYTAPNFLGVRTADSLYRRTWLDGQYG